MNSSLHLDRFRPNPPDAAGILSWVHFGDLHLRTAEDGNARDLEALVDLVNAAFRRSISFVFLPGDNADHGDEPAYRVIRHALDRLQAPWCAIVGDHDVEQKTFAPFQTFLAQQTHYSFTAGLVRFLALNAFDIPEPPSFTVSDRQLGWIEHELQQAATLAQTAVLLLHCYPSDLKRGYPELARLIARYSVRLVDMGHTHYNEIANDGTTLYTATRSTGQIEEGPVGFSVTSLDAGVLSWRFFALGTLPAVLITSPADEHLLPDTPEPPTAPSAALPVRAKIWNDAALLEVTATLRDETLPMHRIPGTDVWETTLQTVHLPAGTHPLRVTARDVRGRIESDEIHTLIGRVRPHRQRAPRDQDNALPAWPAHGLLGTQLGPNKNGRKW